MSNMPISATSSFAFDKITELEVSDTIHKLKNRRSAGQDNAQAKFFNNFKDIFAPILAKFFNLSVV